MRHWWGVAAVPAACLLLTSWPSPPLCSVPPRNRRCTSAFAAVTSSLSVILCAFAAPTTARMLSSCSAARAACSSAAPDGGAMSIQTRQMLVQFERICMYPSFRHVAPPLRGRCASAVRTPSPRGEQYSPASRRSASVLRHSKTQNNFDSAKSQVHGHLTACTAIHWGALVAFKKGQSFWSGMTLPTRLLRQQT